MGFSGAVRTVLRDKYATFSGRADRSEYWWGQLILGLITGVPMLLPAAARLLWPADPMDTVGFFETSLFHQRFALIMTGLGLVGGLVAVVPNIALVARRLHDLGASGWWYLAGVAAGLIPVVGWLASLAVFVAIGLPAGTRGSNRFGPDPRVGWSAEVFR